MRKAYYLHENPFKMFLKKNYCPYCDDLLVLINNHAIVNSKSEEAKKYRSLYEDSDGALIGNFDCDIIHKVFYCQKCNTEIEPKILFSYQKVIKNLAKLLRIAENKKIDMKVEYFPFDKRVNEDLSFFEKIIIEISYSNIKISRECFVAIKRLTYEEATYFKKTNGLKEIKNFLKNVNKNNI